MIYVWWMLGLPSVPVKYTIVKRPSMVNTDKLFWWIVTPSGLAYPFSTYEGAVIAIKESAE